MTDTLVGGTKVYVKDASSTMWGTTPVPSAAAITAATSAFSRMVSFSSTNIDTIVATRVDIYLVPPSFFKANNWSAGNDNPWGYTPKRGSSFINNTLGSESMQYTILHEVGGHNGDTDKLNHAKRVTIAGLEIPAPDTSGAGWWGNGPYLFRPDECSADTFPRAFANVIGPLTGPEYTGGYYYQRHIASTDYGTYRTTYTGAGVPASTTLAASSSIGATNLKVVAVTGLAVGDWIQVGVTPNDEYRILTAVGTAGSGGTGISFTSPLAIAHASAVALVEVPPPSPPGGAGEVDVVVTANTAHGTTRSYTFVNLPVGSSGAWQMRYYDGAAWGPWSDPVAVTLSGVVVPANLTVTPGTLTPDFGVSLSDPRYTIDSYRILVYQVGVAGADVLKMDETVDPMPSASARLAISYTGNVSGPLNWDQQYKWTIEVKVVFGAVVVGGWTAFTPFQFFTPTQNIGALVTPNTTDVKLDTQTPTFTLSAPGGPNIDEARLRLKSDDGASIIWDSGTIGPFTAVASYAVVIPAGVLGWGASPQLDAAVRVFGQVGLPDQFSNNYQVHINAQPGAPSPVTVSHPTAQVVQRSDGVWVCSATQPVVTFPFRDSDVDAGYVDAPVRRSVEIRDMADAQYAASPYTITSAITNDFTAPALGADTTYKTRANYDDSANVRSAWSNYTYIRYSAAPTLSAVTPADGAAITDPTPTFAWTFASAAGKSQASYQLVAAIGNSTVWDSGLVASGLSSVIAPPFTLPTAAVIDWTLTVYDTDGLNAVVSRRFTTAFTVPAAITGLVLTPDTDAKAIIATWTISALPADEFQAYHVYAKPSAGDLRLVTTITDQTIVSYTYLAAAHNTESVIRISQSNGFGESLPTEASATLGTDPAYIPGYWLVTSDAVTELTEVTAVGAGDTVTRLEQLTPLGVPGQRAYSVLLDWGSGGYQSSFHLYMPDRSLVQLLRSYKEEGTVAIFKTWYGDARYVRLTSTPETDERRGWTSGTVSYIEVEPAF